MSSSVNLKVVEFLGLLERANGVVANSPMLSDWSLSDPTGEPDNEVVYFSWESEGNNYSITLTEGSIANGAWVDSSFFCDDHEGDEIQISIYEHIPLVAPSAQPEKAPSAAELAEAHGGTFGEHPDYPVEDWRYQVTNNDTRRGYWDWVVAEVEAARGATKSADATSSPQL